MVLDEGSKKRRKRGGVENTQLIDSPSKSLNAYPANTAQTARASQTV
jgi:hypothetical protein